MSPATLIDHFGLILSWLDLPSKVSCEFVSRSWYLLVRPKLRDTDTFLRVRNIVCETTSYNYSNLFHWAISQGAPISGQQSINGHDCFVNLIRHNQTKLFLWANDHPSRIFIAGERTPYQIHDLIRVAIKRENITILEFYRDNLSEIHLSIALIKGHMLAFHTIKQLFHQYPILPIYRNLGKSSLPLTKLLLSIHSQSMEKLVIQGMYNALFHNDQESAQYLLLGAGPLSSTLVSTFNVTIIQNCNLSSLIWAIENGMIIDSHIYKRCNSWKMFLYLYQTLGISEPTRIYYSQSFCSNLKLFKRAHQLLKILPIDVYLTERIAQYGTPKLLQYLFAHSNCAKIYRKITPNVTLVSKKIDNFLWFVNQGWPIAETTIGNAVDQLNLATLKMIIEKTRCPIWKIINSYCSSKEYKSEQKLSVEKVHWLCTGYCFPGSYDLYILASRDNRKAFRYLFRNVGRLAFERLLESYLKDYNFQTSARMINFLIRHGVPLTHGARELLKGTHFMKLVPSAY
jgi:hypothetical protein